MKRISSFARTPPTSRRSTICWGRCWPKWRAPNPRHLKTRSLSVWMRWPFRQGISSGIRELCGLGRAAGCRPNQRRRLKDSDSQMVAAAREVIKGCEDLRTDQKRQMMEVMSYAKLIIPASALVAMLAGILSAWAITKAVNKPLQRVIAGLEDGSVQVQRPLSRCPAPASLWPRVPRNRRRRLRKLRPQWNKWRP